MSAFEYFCVGARLIAHTIIWSFLLAEKIGNQIKKTSSNGSDDRRFFL
jgi:hypothetical protein